MYHLSEDAIKNYKNFEKNTNSILEKTLGISSINENTIKDLKITIDPFFDPENNVVSEFYYNVQVYSKLNNRSYNFEWVQADQFIRYLMLNHAVDGFLEDSIISNDILFFIHRWAEDGKEYTEYIKFRAKCELLGVPCNKIHKGREDTYWLDELVPDENGVATIPDFITDFREHACDKYKYRKIIWKNPRVTSARYLFYGNKLIEKLDLTECNLSMIPDIREMFSNCVKLKTIDFGNNNFENTVAMSKILYDCFNLETLNLQKAKLTRCKYMWNIAESGCLKRISLSKLRYKTSISSNRYKGRSLVTLYDGHKDPYNCTIIRLKAASMLSILDIELSCKNAVIYVDELTGINLMGGIYEVCDLGEIPDVYNKFIDVDIIAKFREMEPDRRISSANGYVRIVTSEKFADKELLKKYPEKNYKHRIIIGKLYSDYCKIIYFNKHSEWDIKPDWLNFMYDED